MATPSDDKASAAVFSPRTTFDLPIKWQLIYPGMEFTFHMRMELVQDAERVQTEFMMLPDAEQTEDRKHQMDARMIGLLSVAPPEGFLDFPETDGANLAERCYEYFYGPDGNQERRDGMRFICRGTMARYWKAITPADYL